MHSNTFILTIHSFIYKLITNISKHAINIIDNTCFMVVHPLLGYIHKDLDFMLLYLEFCKIWRCEHYIFGHTIMKRFNNFGEVDKITPGSSAYDLTLNIQLLDSSTTQQLTIYIINIIVELN
jgi:hypothetical protein